VGKHHDGTRALNPAFGGSGADKIAIHLRKLAEHLN
jgi:hypothetical protein